MSAENKNTAEKAFGRFLEIIKTLRGPDGCPWDREQTGKSLRPDLLEEVYECIDAINREDDVNLREELGDLFLLVTMISYIYEQRGTFTVADVLDEIAEKLVRRHPHVFADSHVSNAGDVIRQWDAIKTNIEGKHGDGSILNTVPRSLPPLEKAYRYQKKAAKHGFDWENARQVSDKVLEELDELKRLGAEPQKAEAEKELGDLLFSAVNLCRHYAVDPAVALHGANQKFYSRFSYIEQAFRKMGKTLSADEFALMDALWNEAKSLEK